MKTLYLLRHAKAEPGGKNMSDQERTLSPRGREACADMGEYIKRKQYIPAFALASPSARTKETLELVTKAVGVKPKHRFENALYLATAEEILHAVQELGDDVPSVMVVGHNPGMHHIALMLAQTQHTRLREALELKYPTCALTVLRFEVAQWSEAAPGMGTLVDFVAPSEL